MQWITTMKAILNIALVAHDSRKNELLDWVRFNADLLSKHHLYATGTTGRLISELAFGTEEEPEYPFKDKVTRLLSGPLGGDQQIGAMLAEGKIDMLIFFCDNIGAMLAEGKIDMLIFFCDNLAVQGHQNDVSALSRLASLYNIAFATNRTTADMLLTSTLLGYTRIDPECIQHYANRKL